MFEDDPLPDQPPHSLPHLAIMVRKGFCAAIEARREIAAGVALSSGFLALGLRLPFLAGRAFLPGKGTVVERYKSLYKTPRLDLISHCNTSKIGSWRPLPDSGGQNENNFKSNIYVTDNPLM